MSEAVDVVVVGMGPGGEAVAAQLAEAGLSVVGIESRLVGGECPYYGCVPSKMMVRAADALAEARRVPALAGATEVRPDFTPVAKRIREEATTDWDDQVAVERFTATGGRFVRGRAKITGPGRVAVEGQEFTAAKAIVLNTGTDPAIPPVEGLAGTPFWTNREALQAEQAPGSLIVLGGGAIGLELAQAFARFGSTVDVVELADHLLPAEEPEAAEVVTGVFTAEGIGVHTGVGAQAVRHDGEAFTVTLPDRELRAERLLVATGRRTDLAGLGLDSIGLDTEGRFLEPDGHMRVADGVYAIGDMTGKGAFTHMSMYQAGIAVRSILGQDGKSAEYHAVPRVTFTDPEVGAVGLTEREARERDIPVRTAVAELPSSARGWIHKAGNEGLIKLVEDAELGFLVGATAVGPAGGEILSGLAVAVHAQLPVERLRQMIFAYPTFHRAIEDALGKLG
ncbi:dihydrolipoyl dehydrogenase family protein [Amycolatopsis aidingensis]|uniref:dihydrolipoyl dehydrogenase family protein n=1 Tax=Amycolatopsis aidingensis TaxID=2842453 RepID=UPI001C0C2B00|nr:NAD(P)/FAD-dependent oxidoreductase [Amycolatopsis aidingensis]